MVKRKEMLPQSPLFRDRAFQICIFEAFWGAFRSGPDLRHLAAIWARFGMVRSMKHAQRHHREWPRPWSRLSAPQHHQVDKAGAGLDLDRRQEFYRRLHRDLERDSGPLSDARLHALIYAARLGWRI
jgi:hypothetical protein